MSATCNRQGHAQMLNIPSLTVLPALMNALPTVIHVSWMRFQFVCMLYLVYKKLIFCRYSFHSIASFGRTNFLFNLALDMLMGWLIPVAFQTP